MKMEKQIPVKRCEAGPGTGALWENRVDANRAYRIVSWISAIRLVTSALAAAMTSTS